MYSFLFQFSVQGFDMYELMLNESVFYELIRSKMFFEGVATLLYIFIKNIHTFDLGKGHNMTIEIMGFRGNLL